MKFFFVFVLFSLFLISACQTQTPAQTNSGVLVSPDTKEFPQWAKDMRRFDIIAFGSFPFSIFTVTFFSDLYRWNNANGMDFSEEGRRYAPWPVKSAGAVEMDKGEFEQVMLNAAFLSIGIAVTDLVIVKVKRNRERRRIESLPSGTAIIIKKPYKEDEEEPGAPGGESDTK